MDDPGELGMNLETPTLQSGQTSKAVDKIVLPTLLNHDPIEDKQPLLWEKGLGLEPVEAPLARVNSPPIMVAADNELELLGRR